ncbi:protein-tyrosine-phosphatase [Pedobacter soli]|nr:protein-tyrosine-phosphatase [Pedobacter soli]
MYREIKHNISKLIVLPISNERKKTLNELVEYVQSKVSANMDVNINFICTHNSRRSHFSQIWAQIAATYYNIPRVFCYSGGTEATALFPKVVATLINTGFKIDKLLNTDNPIYIIKYSDSSMPIIGFSKVHDHLFNPSSEFAAVITCSQADLGCPFVAGADKRIPITYEDPKVSDNTSKQTLIYNTRSLQIASEMFYVFSMIENHK